MLTIWNPFTSVKTNKSDRGLSTTDYFDRLMKSAINDFMSDLQLPYTQVLGIDTVTNEDGSLSMSVDVPGVKEEDIAVEIVDEFVTVKGERKSSTSQYSINRSFTIPEGYDVETLKAELADGVLTLTVLALPKVESVAKKIEIKAHKTLPEQS